MWGELGSGGRNKGVGRWDHSGLAELRRVANMTSGGSSEMPAAAFENAPWLEVVVNQLPLQTDGPTLERERIAAYVRD